METLYCQLCAATNLFLFEGEKPSVDVKSIFPTLKELLCLRMSKLKMSILDYFDIKRIM